MRMEQEKQQEEERIQRKSLPSAPKLEDAEQSTSTESKQNSNTASQHRPIEIPPQLLEQIPTRLRDQLNSQIILKLLRMEDDISEERIEQLMLEEAIHESESIRTDSLIPPVNNVNNTSSSNHAGNPYVDYVNTFELPSPRFVANFRNSSEEDEEQLQYVLNLSLYEQ